ncbi:MAG TPA: hypothetical protein VFX70_13530 [Mycobacteriales bacterium]|nr:hypothetical protein [Mycobacteriales bacterium]
MNRPITTGLRELLAADLDAALERLLTPYLGTVVAHRQPGHCMRVSDLPAAVAERVCRRLRTAGVAAEVHVLAGADQMAGGVTVTSTKLVELRNPAGDGTQRPPLLVFVPPGSRASAEDSFGVATFEEVDLGDVYAELVEQRTVGIPAHLRPGITELLAVLDEENWPYATSLARARYLLTVERNDHDPTAAGAAVFELGLVPDFDLFADPGQVRGRAARNVRQMRILTFSTRPERQRVLELGLTDATFRARLAELVTHAGLEDPHRWTRRVVIDRTNWPLAFHRWPLTERQDRDSVRIEVAELNLPVAGERPEHATDPILRAVIGQRYLPTGPTGLNQLPVSFQVAPDPRQIRGLARFSAQLVSEDAGPTGVLASVGVSRTSRTEYKATLRKLRKADLDEGWYFIRVLPLDTEGIALPVDGDSAGAHPRHESERFYLVPAGGVDEPPQPRAHREPGVAQALCRLRFDALAEGRDWSSIAPRTVSWKGTTGAGRHTLRAGFGPDGIAEIPLAATLVDIERRILAEAGPPVRWRLSAGAESGKGLSGQPVMQPVTLTVGPGSQPLETFLDARRRLFAQIRGEGDLIVEGCELIELCDGARDYAEAYAELMTWYLRNAERTGSGLADLAALSELDTVTVEFGDQRGNRAEAVMVAPTHPLRLLWLVTWARLGESWLYGAAGADPALVRSARHSLLAELFPLGFPLVVPRPDGRLTVAAGDLTPYWGVCLPTGTDDPGGLLRALADAVGVPDRQATAPAVSARALANRVERYLRLHPYVRTLTIAAVNPGRGERLADMLVALQHRRGLGDISYDLRLFLPDRHARDAGAALADLLRGEWSSAEEAEAFRTPTAGGLIPKLAVSLRPLAEFRSASSRHSVHLTMLFDAFGGEHFDAAPAGPAATAPVHGLVQDMAVTYREDDVTVAWHKQPRHGPATPLPGAEELTDLLGVLPKIISQAAAAVTTGQAGTGQLPRITLGLDVADRTLLHQAHRSSDWVITVDRTMGAEYFDSPAGIGRPDYVIDYAPEGVGGFGHHVVISSRSVDELRALLAPAIAQHGLGVDARHVGMFFDQLRALSGRLAFKLASTAPTQRTEVLGLALARLYLDYQGVLADQILVPLDAHLELYREARRQAADEVGDSVGLRRTDLALFDLDAARHTITCRLVEVKCLSALDLAGYQGLKDRIAGQLDRSAQVLSEHFDPWHAGPDRPDRPDRVVKNAELAVLLRFYLDRAVRHRLVRPDAEAEARWMLDRLDRLDPAYRLEFTRTGLIFDLSGVGADREVEGGVEFHRIGRDVARELVEAVPTDPVLAAHRVSEPEQPEQPWAASTLATVDLTVPRPPQAAYRAGDRVRGPLPDDVVPAAGAGAGAESGTDTGTNVESGAEAGAGVRPGRSTSEAAAGQPDQSTPDGGASPEPSTGKHAPVPATPAEPAAAPQITPEVFVGTDHPSPQYGILGEAAGRRVALDLNETHTISLFGVQGGGKSYTLGSIMEMACLPAPPLNRLPRPLATVVFHYSQSQDYAPEFTSMVAGNDDAGQVRRLRERYGVKPRGLPDVVMLAPEDQVPERRREYPDIEVLPLKFGSTELRAEHWRFLMGAIGNQSTYIRQLQRIMRAHRADLRLDTIRDATADSNLPDHLKQLANQRLDLAADYIDDAARIRDLVRPGRMIIVDLRDEFIEKDEALGLFVVLMQIFADAQDGGTRFNKLVVFDEAHKYIDSPDLVDGLVSSVREMRHKGMSVLVASQDPLSVPTDLIALSNHIILHKFTSPTWLKHLQKANAALADLTAAKMAALDAGEAYLWSLRATDTAFVRSAVKIRGRPRITRHGGGTKTAVER